MNSQQVKPLINELARLTWALLPYIILGAIAWLLVSPEMATLPAVPIIVGVMLKVLPWPQLRLVTFVLVSALLLTAVRAMWGDGAAWVLFGASCIRLGNALR